MAVKRLVKESGEAEILFGIVKSLYGGRLSQEELEEVRRDVELVVGNSMAVRAVRLRNSDEPATVFRPRRGED